MSVWRHITREFLKDSFMTVFWIVRGVFSKLASSRTSWPHLYRRVACWESKASMLWYGSGFLWPLGTIIVFGNRVLSFYSSLFRSVRIPDILLCAVWAADIKKFSQWEGTVHSLLFYSCVTSSCSWHLIHMIFLAQKQLLYKVLSKARMGRSGLLVKALELKEEFPW